MGNLNREISRGQSGGQDHANRVEYAAVNNSFIDLLDVWGIIKQQKWIILFIFTLMFLLTAVYSFIIATPVYRADSIILINKDDKKISGFSGLTSGGFARESDTYVRTQYEMLRNRTLANKVITELGLMEKLEKKSLRKKKSPEDLFLESLFIESIERTDLVKVNYDSEDPNLASNIVNTIITNAIKLQLENKGNDNNYAIEYLQGEVIKARDRLLLSENNMVQYANEQGVLSIDDKQSAPLGRLRGLYQSLGTASAVRIEAESVYRQAKRNRNAPDIIANPLVNSLKTRLSTLEASYQEKSKLFKPEYPDMQMLSRQMEQVRKSINVEVGNTRRSVRSRYLAAKEAEGKVRASLESYESELMVLQDKGVELNTLKREVSSSRQLYEDMLKKLQEIKVSSKIGSSNITVIDVAVPPIKQYRPKPYINLLVGSVVGLILGLGVGFLRNLSSQKITSGSQLQKMTGLGILGTIPKDKRLFKSRRANVITSLPNSAITQAFRILSTNLNHNSRRNKPKVIIVTSTSPSEGKSTTAVNLAYTQASSSSRVLLIDADMRKSSVHSKLGIKNRLGLSDFLNGDVRYANVTHPQKDQEGLFVMTAGTLMSDPVRLLASTKMKSFLTVASKHFDSIIIDTPPLMGFADTLMLAAISDATLIIADEGQMERKKIKKSLSQLYRINPNILGFVVTKAKSDVVDDNYYLNYYSRKKQSNFNLFGSFSGSAVVN